MLQAAKSTSARCFRRLLILCFLTSLAGCPRPDAPAEKQSDTQPSPAVKLRLLVVGDPELAKAIRQLDGEWNAQTGGEFQVESTSDTDPIPPDKLGVDAIVAPSYHLGGMAERREVLPAPPDMLRDGEGNWSGIFSVLRAHEATWRGQVMGIPMGSPVLTIHYRADLLEKLGREPPRTWAEYQKLAELLADRKGLGDAAPPANQPWHGTLEPLGPGWAGLTLLARAAAYATHRGNYSTLFNIDAMTPLIGGPPFVRALEELVAAAKLGQPDPKGVDPAAARKAFWAGQCGMALTWPTAAVKMPPAENRTLRVGFAELPGSKDVYNVSNRVWETRREKEDTRVPLAAIAGRIGMVSSRSATPEIAFRLLFWLSDDQWSRQVRPVCAASPMTTLFRRPQVMSPREWVEEAVPAAAATQYAGVIEQALSRPKSLLALPIPGRSEYLAALDKAVQSAVRGEASPEASLRKAASEWQKITDRLGRPSQRQAYGHSVGLD